VATPPWQPMSLKNLGSSKVNPHLLISINKLPISINRIIEIDKWCTLTDINNWISDINKSFIDIDKSITDICTPTYGNFEIATYLLISINQIIDIGKQLPMSIITFTDIDSSTWFIDIDKWILVTHLSISNIWYRWSNYWYR